MNIMQVKTPPRSALINESPSGRSCLSASNRNIFLTPQRPISFNPKILFAPSPIKPLHQSPCGSPTWIPKVQFDSMSFQTLPDCAKLIQIQEKDTPVFQQTSDFFKHCISAKEKKQIRKLKKVFKNIKKKAELCKIPIPFSAKKISKELKVFSDDLDIFDPSNSQNQLKHKNQKNNLTKIPAPNQDESLPFMTPSDQFTDQNKVSKSAFLNSQVFTKTCEFTRLFPQRIYKNQESFTSVFSHPSSFYVNQNSAHPDDPRQKSTFDIQNEETGFNINIIPFGTEIQLRFPSQPLNSNLNIPRTQSSIN